MTMPNLVIFDMDGILFDTERIFLDIRYQVMEEFGFHQTFSEYIKLLGTSGQTANEIIYQQYRKDFPAEEIFQITRKKMNRDIDLHGLKPKLGILSLLLWLNSKKIPCCIATSTDKTIAEKYVLISGIRDYFQFIIGAGDFIKSKPDPEIFLRCAANFKVAAEHCLVIEDSQNGIKAAHDGNFPVVCIPDMQYPDRESIKYCLAIFNDGIELLSYLKELSQNE